MINIDYTGDIDFVKIRTLNNQEYLADHVIVTQSLGVLKADYQSLFNPPLPESKITNIKVRDIFFFYNLYQIIYFNE